MLKKSRIAMLVAGTLFAAQTGVVLAHPDDDAMWLNGSSSSSGPQQLTVFNPDGSSYSITPVDIQVAVESDAVWSAESSAPQQVSVFNPDGTSYSIVPADEIQVATLEPALLVAADESLPQQLTVFEPKRVWYSYEFTPIEVAMLQPVEVVAMEDDISIAPVALSDEDAMLRPTYVAHFVSPPSYTGILEEALS